MYSIRSTALLAALLLAACNGSNDFDLSSGTQSSTATSGGGVESGEAVARMSAPAGLGCGWQLVSDINTTNAAFPDESAQYWVALIPQLPQTRLRIDGRYPAVRYFSFNVYDPLLRPIDAIADYEIEPEAGSANPFVNEAASAGGHYTAWVELTGKPEERATNTIYSGVIDLNGNAVPKPLVTGLFYRTYVPDEGFGFEGGVELPVLTLVGPDGETELLPFAQCDEPLLPNLGGNLPDPGLNDLLLTIDFPEELGVIRFPTATYPPATRVFYGLGPTAVAILSNSLPVPLPPEVEQNVPLGDGGGFLSNIHNAYTTTAFSRNDGSIFILRGRAPTYPGDDRLNGGIEDVRFWSICQNEFVTQRYVGCVADHQALLDEQGFYTVVVSDAPDRPDNAIEDRHINWLPWGPFPDGLLIYRHMLPSPHFAQAIQNVPKGTPPEEVMGDYVAVGAYCQRETFEAVSGNAAEIFDACLQETLNSGQEAL
ncbi:MAG: hypothetical protein ACPHER_10895, partial [Nevskiales bacterium]